MIPESELLLCCARKELDGESRTRIESLLAGTLRWEYLLSIARLHGMRPLLFRHLRAWKERIPQDFFESLNSCYQSNSFRNLSLTRELLNLIRMLEEQGIEAVPYKGPVLAQIAYGDLSLREFADLDLLIRKSDVLRARDLLIGAGYQPVLTLSPAEEAAFLRTQCEFGFLKGNCLVELHWTFVEKFFPFPMDMNVLWSRLQKMQLGGQAISTLSAEDLMLILSVHNAKHLWERIGWVSDISELIRQGSWNDQTLFERAKQLGCHRMLSLAFVLARNLTRTQAPEISESHIEQSSAIRELAKDIENDLTSGSEERQSIVRQPSYRPRYLQLWESRRDRLRYFFRAFTTPTIEDWKEIHLPGYLFPLYHVIRPFRLFLKYLKR